jgi:hypothetical protein
MALSISLGGKVVEGKREHEKTLQDIEEKNLELRKQQRREEAREGLMIDPEQARVQGRKEPRVKELAEFQSLTSLSSGKKKVTHKTRLTLSRERVKGVLRF